MTQEIIVQWTPCLGCGSPVIHRGGGIYVDAAIGGHYGSEQVDCDVEHECQ